MSSMREARIAQIATNAIREINNLLNANATQSTSNNPSGIQMQSSSTARAGNRDGNVLSELRSRFPTLASNTGSPAATARRSNLASNRSNRSGTKDYTIKDIVIVGANTDKTPVGREEKLQLERRNRVISGFAIDKTWNHKELYSKVKAQFPDDCKNIDFEFVKNCYGALVKPRLANGVKIDGSILLKSIASTTTVYIRLFAVDLDESDDDSEFDKSPFDLDGKKSEMNKEEKDEEITTINLGHVLQFVCGTDEEPVLGFVKTPQINFIECDSAFIPTANTCINVLNLPSPSSIKSLPNDEVFFLLLDYAFGTSYFGIV